MKEAKENTLFGFYKIKSKYHKEYPDNPQKNKWFKYNVQPSLYDNQSIVTTIEMEGGKKVEVTKIIDDIIIDKLINTGLIIKIELSEYLKLK